MCDIIIKINWNKNYKIKNLFDLIQVNITSVWKSWDSFFLRIRIFEIIAIKRNPMKIYSQSL